VNPLEIADRVVDLVGDRAEAHVNVLTGPSALTRFANSFIHQNVAEEQLEVSLTVAVDGRVATRTGSRVDALEELVESALEVARLRPVDSEWPGVAPPAPIADFDRYDPDTASAEPARRAGVVRDFVQAGPQLRAAGYCSTSADRLGFANTAGHRGEVGRTVAILDGIHQTDTSAGKAHGASARIVDLDGSGLGGEAARLATASADPADLEPGRYQVVLGPECVATVAVFLAAYGFNARAHIEDRSFVRLGSRQFDPAFSMWDDPEGGLGFAVDVEGTPKRQVVFVDRGVSTSLAHDRRTARLLDTDSTGHAVPGGAQFGAFPTDLVVGPGDRTVEELVGSVERGLLVTEFNYCRVVEPKSLVVTGLTRNGTFLIEDGRVVGAVTNLRFTQSFVEGLAEGAVLGVGSVARFADSELGPTLVRAPAMRLASWNFTGGARG
jgi:predicted Zn-dependent protease